MNKIVALSGAVLGVVTALLAVLAAFGVSLSDGQQNAITGAVSAGLVLISGWFTPNQVIAGKVAAKLGKQL